MADSSSKKANPAAPVHWAWVILVLCFVNLFINYGIRLGYGVVLPEMIKAMGLSRKQGGDIFNSYLFFYILASPFIGYLTDRLGARRVISLFGISLGVGSVLMGSVSGFGQACLFFGLVGIGASAMWVPILAIAQRWFTLRKRGMALGILSTGCGFGLAVIGSVFPTIVEYRNWRYCWYFLGIAALCMVPVNALFLRSAPEDMKLRPWGDEFNNGLAFQAPGETEKRKGRYREILGTSRFWKIGLSYTFIAGSLYAVTTYLVDYARYSLGFSYDKASFLATVHGVGQVFGVLAVLPLSDFFGRRRTIIFSNLILSAIIGSIVLAGTHDVWLLVSVSLFGAFFGATFPIYGVCGGDYFRKEVLGTVVGAWTPFYGLGIIGSNRLTGYLRDVTGSFEVPFVVMISSALVASLLMFSVNDHPNRGVPLARAQS